MKKVEAESLGAVHTHTIHLENKRINSEESCKKPTAELAIRNKEGITLIALVVTIIIIMILARNKYINANRRKWNTKENSKSKN